MLRGDLLLAVRTDETQEPCWAFIRRPAIGGYTYAEEFESTSFGFGIKDRTLQYRCGSEIRSRAMLLPGYAVVGVCLMAGLLPLLVAVRNRPATVRAWPTR